MRQFISKKIILVIMAIILVGVAVFYFFKQSGTIDSKPAGTTPAVSTSVLPPKNQVQHVLIVVEENQDYDSVMGNTKDMPYLNSLANSYAYAKDYYANVHPSMGNYFVLTAGDIISKDDNFSATVNADNIVRHLVSSGKTWKEYSENLPSVGYTGGAANGYTQHHNPLSYFSDVRNNNDQKQNLVPFSQFATDVSNHNLPNYSFIVPNNEHNAHSCPSGQSVCSNDQKLSAADNWLKTNIDPLINSPDFNSPGGGILIITFDESGKLDRTGGGGHVAWIAVGPDIKKGFVSTTRYQHENTLRFMSEAIGLTDFPGQAANASNMQEFIVRN